MDTKKKIVVIGSSNTDMVIKSDRLPKPGETILGGNFLMNHGGKGANQAVAAARLGGDVTFICKIGNDIFGNETLEMFHKEKIDTTYVGITPQEPSGVALINVRRRRWLLKKHNEYISRNWRMVAEGTRMTQDFASFLKELY